jgi:hypothetical protein
MDLGTAPVVSRTIRETESARLTAGPTEFLR